jgi:hypothetical protein
MIAAQFEFGVFFKRAEEPLTKNFEHVWFPRLGAFPGLSGADYLSRSSVQDQSYQPDSCEHH